MGLGGLLKEIVTRPQPRELRRRWRRTGCDGDAALASRASRAEIAALVLAGGRSTRYGARTSCWSRLRTACRWSCAPCAHALASRAAPVIVVTGHEADAVAAALAGLDVRIVHNPDFADGLSTSLKAGLAAVPPEADGVARHASATCRAIEARHLDRLIAAFSPKEGRAIVVPVASGQARQSRAVRGEPLSRSCSRSRATPAPATSSRRAPSAVAEVDLATDAIFLDIDTPEALARAAKINKK